LLNKLISTLLLKSSVINALQHFRMQSTSCLHL